MNQTVQLSRPTFTAPVGRVAATSFSAAGDWYPPALIGAETVIRRLYAGDYVRAAGALLERLQPDPFTDYLRQFYAAGQARFGADWRYADIVTVLLCLADMLRPARYLEVGVRRGRSACAVASRAPDCALELFDMWQVAYAGMDNPGPALVRPELAAVGHRGPVRFTDGDSHQTLPAFLADHPDLSFDLITIDGDHSVQGAAQDLVDTLPRLAVGGAVVFDDICHPAHADLGRLWQAMVANDPRFSAAALCDAGYGVGFAIRRF